MSSLFAEPKALPGQPALSLFIPSESNLPIDPGDLLLRQAFELYLRPYVVKSGTVQSYYTALRHWEKSSANPPARLIDNETMRSFLDDLQTRGLGPETRAKIGRTLRAILRRLGPPTDGNPRGVGAISRVPWIEMPKLSRRLPRIASADELDRIYEACRVAVWPKIDGVSAPRYWRALLVALYNLGPRLWSEILCDGLHERGGWFWDQFRFDRKASSGDDIWSISFFAEKTDRPLMLPVAPVVRAHLESIRGDRAAIFPATADHGSFYDQWKMINAVAGLPVEGNGKLNPHDLRKTCQSEWDAINPLWGNWILGHADHAVAARYRNFARHVAEACVTLPQPASFVAGIS